MTTEAEPKKKYSSTPSSTNFEEVGRIQVSDVNTIVVSKCSRNGVYRGISVNKYVTSDAFTGFSKGTFIPEENTVAFLKLFDREDLATALEELGPKPQPTVSKTKLGKGTK